MRRILVLDNYDSFTYNLVAMLRHQPDTELKVLRNDQAGAADLSEADALVLSPGPGIPSEAGNLMEITAAAADRMPVLGVCLGHQALGEYAGARLRNLDRVFHGWATPIQIIDQHNPLFAGMASGFSGGRYHSWVVEPDTLPLDWVISAVDADGQIMAMRHGRKPLYGLQFHPESVLTPDGIRLMQNFIGLVPEAVQVA